ncbi:MAG TPA: metallophosphoesterase family protein [Bacteroidales bacterium]|nr:metallophosphoesterase family protein [Bacteroidales bacterium]
MERNSIIKAKELKHLIICGDVHGKFREFGYRLKNFIENAIVIVAGDVGMGFHKPGYYRDEFTKLNKTLVKKNIVVFFVRGNHDDPEYFRWETPLNDELSNIMLVPDYYTLKTGAGNVLCVGGAISIDRKHRVIDESYWAGEPCIYDEDAINELEDKIDVVVTHTAPDYVKPFTKLGIENWTFYDRELETDCLIERGVMNNIYQQLKEKGHKVKYWGYGHFHMSNQMDYEDTRFICCDELELVELNINKYGN